ncbi:MAG TPA: hypothetical protein VMJ32_17435 [Pirellulales bacterium]|nr:hypothetical protein [Pirellulales bacterium]
MAAYQFITIWRFEQPIERVWEAINAAEDYPRWWADILYYQCLTPENPRGVGACGRRAVRGFLPYSLQYTTTITRCESPSELAYDAEGDLIGEGRFELRDIRSKPHGSSIPNTEVTIYWNVSTKGRWLNRLAPLLKWLFAANHHYVMRRGERGLALWLERNL